jgi:hypothetical protein
MCACMCVHTYIYFYLPIAHMSRHVVLYLHCCHFSTCNSTDHTWLSSEYTMCTGGQQTNKPTKELNIYMDQSFLEKLTVPQLVKKFAAFYGTWRVITVVITFRLFCLSWVRQIESSPITVRYILILSSLEPLKWFLSLRFSYQISVCILLSAIRPLRPAHAPWFHHRNIWRGFAKYRIGSLR